LLRDYVCAQQDYSSNAPKLSLNDCLRVASTFVGLSLIMEQLSPVGSKDPTMGIEMIEADYFRLYCLHPATGELWTLLAHRAKKYSRFSNIVYFSISRCFLHDQI
jgi:hypothetical protein